MPTTPGFHIDTNISAYPPDVRKAISHIARHFYVTRTFKSVEVGNSEYWAALVRPTTEFSIYVNTDREILVLFAGYATFEIRTLEAFDYFYDLLESKRVDRSVRFLVSADRNIENIIKHYLDQHPEYPVIIPIDLQKVAAYSNNILLESVRRNFIIRDLFGYQNPLREETFFFGRQDVVQSVLDLARSGQSSSVFGLRKSGKTSAIYAIQRKSKGFSCTAVIIDCQNPAVHARNYSDLLSYIIAQVKAALGKKGAAPDLGSDLPLVSEKFYQHIKSALGEAKTNILIIFDEVENISPRTAASPHWRSGNDPIYFWQILRSFIQSDSKGRLSVCIVGTSPHILEAAKINDVDNPIYLFAQKRFIPNLTFDETKEMVQRLGYFMGLDFRTELIAILFKTFGGHPFFTRQVCSLVHRQLDTNRPITVSPKALRDAQIAFEGQMESFLRDILEHLQRTYEEEFNLLKAIVAGDKDEALEYSRDAPDLIDHLIGYELIERFGDGIDLKFDAIRPALEKLLPIGRNSAETYWTELVLRRNAVERSLRTAIFYWSKMLPQTDWAVVVERSLTKRRFEALPSIEPGPMFSNDESPLYLTDLIGFLRQGDALPYLGDRRSAILEALDQINKLRRDAHALDVESEDMSQVRLAFELCETEFNLK